MYTYAVQNIVLLVFAEDMGLPDLLSPTTLTPRPSSAERSAALRLSRSTAAAAATVHPAAALIKDHLKSRGTTALKGNPAATVASSHSYRQRRNRSPRDASIAAREEKSEVDEKKWENPSHSRLLQPLSCSASPSHSSSYSGSSPIDEQRRQQRDQMRLDELLARSMQHVSAAM